MLSEMARAQVTLVARPPWNPIHLSCTRGKDTRSVRSDYFDQDKDVFIHSRTFIEPLNYFAPIYDPWQQDDFGRQDLW